MWCELILDYFILDVTLYLDWDFFSNYKVRTQRRFPLDTNLTKWLSKCEGSLLEGKGKIQEYGDWWWMAKCKRAWKEKQEHNENIIDKGWSVDGRHLRALKHSRWDLNSKRTQASLTPHPICAE